jgi:hypothetical protein
MENGKTKFYRTIRDEILYEYAKLMSRVEFAGGVNKVFVEDRFKALKDGLINMSQSIREWQKEHDLPSRCAFCGAEEDLQTGRLIPQNRGGTDSPDNSVLACKACSDSRGSRGIFGWIGYKKRNQLNQIVTGKYLKELFELHEAKGTLSMDGRNLDRLCKSCQNYQTCVKNNKTGDLTHLCLESML